MTIIAAALLAVSIFSEKVDTFTHLPDWMPKDVPAEHTFGSDERTNSTHRTTSNTLSAVASIFDAYHERTLYASEGASLYADRNWDVSVYGPRLGSANMQHVWYTNALEQTNHCCYVYPHTTNGYERAARDTRRLVEFDNLNKLSERIPDLFRRWKKPLLFKGESWGTNRLVMFASSWMPTNDIPKDTNGWIEGPLTKSEVSLGSQLVPLCYLKTDSYFVTEDFGGKEYGLLYDVLMRNDEHFNVLQYYLDGGEDFGGFLGEWRDGGYEHAAFASNSVPDIITNTFPKAGPEFAMNNFSRRLLPDDYVYSSTISTSYWEKVDSVTRPVNLYQFRQDGTERGLPYYNDFTSYDVEFYQADRYRFDESTKELKTLTLLGKRPTYVSTGDETVSGTFDEGLSFATDKQFDRYELTIGEDHATGTWTFDRWADSGLSKIFTWSWKDPIVNVTVDYWKFIVETNSINASSLVATESRALAMLDRTYEVPCDNGYTNGPRQVNLTRFRADYVSDEREVDVEIVGSPGDLLNVQIIPISIDDFGFDDTTIYQTSNSVELIDADGSEDQFRVEYSKFSGVDHDLNTIVRCTNSFSRVLARVSDIARRGGTSFDLASEEIYFVTLHAPTFEQDWSYSVWANFDSARYHFTCHIADFNDLGGFRFKATAQVRATLKANLVESRDLPENFIQRITSPVGPGIVGRSNGMVSDARVLYFDEQLERYSKRDEYGYPMDDYWYEWFYFKDFGFLLENQLEPNRWPYDPDLNDRTYYYHPRFRISHESVTDGIDALAKIQGHFGDLRSQVHNRLANRLGLGTVGNRQLIAQDVIPVFPLTRTFSGFSIYGVDVGVEFKDVQPGMYCILPAGEERANFYTADGKLLSGDEPAFAVTYGIDLRKTPLTGDGLNPAVSVSARTSPVIVTDWNWKALKKSTTGDKQ